MAGRIKLEPWRDVDDRVELAATLEHAGATHRLWWRVAPSWRDALTTWADSFVIGFLFPIMAAGGDVDIDGPVSPSLLRNLEKYNEIWRMWMPRTYRTARLRARDEVEPPVASEKETQIVPFSCGVDSCFTLFRHARGLAGRSTRPIGAGITFLGFDIQTFEANAAARYAKLRAGAATLLDSVGVPLIEVESNFRSLPQFWKSSHATQLASGLALFGRRFSGAMIANSVAYDHLDRPSPRLGSHPLTDPFLSSERFQIADDGGTFRRWEKAAVLGAWPEAMRHLQVCFSANGEIGNCGRCEKCIRTAIAFRIAGVDPPDGLPTRLTPRSMRHLRISVGGATASWTDLQTGIEARGQESTPWARGVRSVIRRTKRRGLIKSIQKPFVPLRDGVRRLLRGTSKSRKQIAAERDASTPRS